MSNGRVRRMTSIGRISSGVHAALQAASASANVANPRDVPGLVQLAKHLRDLDSELSLDSRPDEAQLCKLLLQMTERLKSQQHPSADELIPWMIGMIEYLGAALGVDLTDEWTRMKMPARAAVHDPPRVDLKLDVSDGFRIGEILVQMSFLEMADVARALEIQRETNCKLGEALVMLGLITDKGLEAALKIQRKKRGEGS
jgi:hypothetical protein